MTPGTAILKDHILIDLALAGRTECFSVLVDRHQQAVRRRIRSMAHNSSDEDDLVQEVFLKAWIHLAGFRAEASFRTWLAQIATNEVLQFYRRERHCPIRPATIELDRFPSPLEPPLQAVERGEATRLVRRAIAQLPEIYRQVLILRDLKQLTQAEAVRLMKTNLSVLKTRLHRGRRLLLKAIQQQTRRKNNESCRENGHVRTALRTAVR